METQAQRMAAIADLAMAGASVEELQTRTGKGLGAVTSTLIRWVRCTGRTDVAPWVEPEHAARVAEMLGCDPRPTLTQIAADVQVPMWAVQLVAAAVWNAGHPVANLPQVPIGADGNADLARMLVDRWPMANLVRATGLHTSTLEARIAQFLAAQPEPDVSPWLTEPEIARVSALLDGASAFHTVRRAQARGETTRGKVAMVLALRGQWQPRPPTLRQPKLAHHGKAWSRAEDVVVRAAQAAGMALGDLAQALERSPEAVLHRAQHLGLLATAEPRAWRTP